MSRFQKAWREAVGIILFAVMMGFSYTYVQQKGLFAQPKSERVPLGNNSVAPSLIDLQQALSLFQAGEATFIDSRHEYDYNLGHIRGALNLPLAEFETKRDLLATLPHDRVIVTYCDGADCNSSIELATKLTESGFTSVRVFFAGWAEWQLQNLPVAVSP